jgi:hypothetical protein
MIHLGCTWERSDLFREGCTLKQVFYDVEGNIIYTASFRTKEETGIDINVREDPTSYHREYYRRVRRFRDKRKSRGFSKV